MLKEWYIEVPIGIRNCLNIGTTFVRTTDNFMHIFAQTYLLNTYSPFFLVDTSLQDTV